MGQPLWVQLGLTPTSTMSRKALLDLFLLRLLHQWRCDLLPALLSLLPGQRRHQSPASTTEQHNHCGAKSKRIFFFVPQVVFWFFLVFRRHSFMLNCIEIIFFSQHCQSPFLSQSPTSIKLLASCLLIFSFRNQQEDGQKLSLQRQEHNQERGAP